MREWILRLAGTAFLCWAVCSLCPEGSGKKALRTVCAFVLLASALRPFASLDWDGYALRLSRYREEGEQLAEEGSRLTETETRLGIQERLEEYILDKARSLGVPTEEVRVRVSWSKEGFWVPEAVTLRCSADVPQNEDLRHWIAAELGIPPERQSWNLTEGGGGTGS